MIQAHRKVASRIIIGCRIAIVLTVCMILAVSRSSTSSMKPLGNNPAVSCIDDFAHHATASMNIIIRQYRTFGKLLELVSSLLVDTAGLYTMIAFVIEAKTARLLYCIIVFYGVRALLQVHFL